MIFTCCCDIFFFSEDPMNIKKIWICLGLLCWAGSQGIPLQDDVKEINSQWLASPHAQSMNTAAKQKQVNQKGCAHCHTAEGYEREILGKLPSNAPYRNATGLTCTACHFSNKNKPAGGKLKAGNRQNACNGCHDSLVQNNEKEFSSCPQGSFLLGKAGLEIEGEPLPSLSPHLDEEKNCTGCHMAKAPPNISSRVGGHTFRVTSKDENEVINPNGCTNCHEINLTMLRNRQAYIKKLMKTLATLLPKRSGSPAKIKRGEEPKFPGDPSLSKTEANASFNYYQVLKDGSWGAHNPKYTKKLLQTSINSLTKEQNQKQYNGPRN